MVFYEHVNLPNQQTRAGTISHSVLTLHCVTQLELPHSRFGSTKSPHKIMQVFDGTGINKDLDIILSTYAPKRHKMQKHTFCLALLPLTNQNYGTRVDTELIGRPTRGYWYLDFYVDHLFSQSR